MSHARYGYWTSSFDECTVLVVDAIGEWDTLTQWKVKNDFECEEMEISKVNWFILFCNDTGGWLKPMKKNIFSWVLQQ